jgi:geranylgeranyl diphosphate synthase type I
METQVTALGVNDRDLEEVQRVIRSALASTCLKNELDRLGANVGAGKMLRSRLLVEIGLVTGEPRNVLYHLGAAVELIHGASLLHDDIIDGGMERRHAAALWVSEGTKLAVLIGDLLLSVALSLVQDIAPGFLPSVITALRAMCDGEAEQEFICEEDGSWDECVRIARSKTGSLFGLAATCAAGSDEALAEALERAGYDLGTAYQLADDLLDLCPDTAFTGKSQGTDAATGKLTAASAHVAEGVPIRVIEELLSGAERGLAAWPHVQQRWCGYVDAVVRPLIEEYARRSQEEVA